MKPPRDELDIWNAERMAALTLHISAGKKKKKNHTVNPSKILTTSALRLRQNLKELSYLSTGPA